MVIKTKESDFFLFVEDDAGRVIYQITCFNRAHYELVKRLLIDIREGKKVNDKMLKPLEP